MRRCVVFLIQITRDSIHYLDLDVHSCARTGEVLLYHQSLVSSGWRWWPADLLLLRFWIIKQVIDGQNLASLSARTSLSRGKSLLSLAAFVRVQMMLLKCCQVNAEVELGSTLFCVNMHLESSFCYFVVASESNEPHAVDLCWFCIGLFGRQVYVLTRATVTF